MRYDGTIYMYTFDDGKRYIGQTMRSLDVRHREHLTMDNQIVNRQIRTHKYKLEILTMLPINELDFAEQYFIKEFNTLYPNGWNFNSGGSANRYPSEITRHKMSENHQYKHGYIPYWLGKKRSPETCKKIAHGHRGKVGELNQNFGRKHSEQTRKNMSDAHNKAVVMCDKITGQILQEFKSQFEAHETLKIHQGDISACCRMIRQTAGGYVWRFKG